MPKSDPHRRVLIFFEKSGEALSLSHLETMRTLESAVRRTGLPVRTSGGEEPKVKLSFPTALPQGMESSCEAVELAVEPRVAIREIVAAIDGELPEGLRARSGDALYRGEKWNVDGVLYEVRGAELPPREEIEALLASERVPVERRRKTVDLKPLLSGWERTPDRLAVGIRWTDAGTARPEDLLRALGRDPDLFTVKKVGMRFRTSFGETITRR